MFDIEEFYAAFTTLYCSVSNFDFQEKTMYIVRQLHRKRVEKNQLFYPTISQRSCYVKHFTNM